MTKSLSLFLAVVMVLSCITITKPNKVSADSTAYTIKVNLGTNCTTVYKNGKAIKNASLLNEGDEIITRLYKGEVVSVVTNKLSKK